MPDGLDIDFSELDRLVIDLGAGTQLERVIPKASLAVRRTAFDVVGTAQELVPVDTGATRQSIHASDPGGGSLGPTSLDAEIGGTTEYEPFLEYGTHKMAPREHLGPALDMHTPNFLAALVEIGGAPW